MNKFRHGLVPTMLVLSFLFTSCGSGLTTRSQVFFDDFSYSSTSDPNITTNHWEVRTGGGGPGAAGVRWLEENISFVADPDQTGNQLLQLSASTSGSGSNTTQAEFSQQRKFYEGTYASRVRFTDAPVSGTDGDQINETFFTITPLNYDLDLDYGELDFEYLANGGWGSTGENLWMTTWETYRPDPWSQQSKSDHLTQSMAGWHTLIIQVANGEVKYYVDGVLEAIHGDKYYPETPMLIDYNLWFIDGGFTEETTPRNYIEQVDWLLYVGNEILAPEQVNEKVAAYRSESTQFVDTVKPWIQPPFSTPIIPTVTPAPTRIPGAVRPFEQEIHQVSEISVDGELSDWPVDPTFVLNEKSQIVYAAEDDNWGGPDDFSTQAWVGWADDGLFVAFKVTDNALLQGWTGGDMWQGDYMELQIDTQLEQDFTDTEPNEDDFQIGISPGNFSTIAAETNLWSGAADLSMTPDIQQVAIRTANGYILEAFIPRDFLTGLVLSDGATFGMNVNPSDADDPDVPQKLMMSTSAIRSLTDPTTFGKIILVP